MCLAVNIIGGIALILMLAEMFKEDIVTVLPVFICGLTVTLYILSFLNALSCIDYLFAAFIVYFIVRILLHKNKKELADRYIKILLKPSVLLVLVVFTAVVLLLKDSMISVSYDDFKYWAASTKALYYNNGLEPQWGQCITSLWGLPNGHAVV